VKSGVAAFQLSLCHRKHNLPDQLHVRPSLAFPEAMITLPGKSYPDSDLITACAGLILAPRLLASLMTS
jgi:hypothetical protein